MGYWVDLAPGLPHDGPRVRRVGLVVAQGHLRQGPAVPRLPHHPVLPALRHRRCPTTSWASPAGTRRSPARRCTSACPSPPARSPSWAPTCSIWTTTPWTLVSNTAVAVHPDVTYVAARARRARRGPGRGRAAAGAGARRGRPSVLATRPGRRAGAHRLPAALRPGGHPRRALRGAAGDYVTTEDGTGLVHQAPAFGADDLADLQAATACRSSTRSGRTAASCGRVPLVGGMFFKDADERLIDDLQRARPAVPRRPVRAQLPALLALPHRAALLRAPRLVHPHHRDQGPAAARRTRRPTGSPRRSRTAGTASGCATTSTGRCRAAATGARRCRCGLCGDDEEHVTCVGSLKELGELAGRDLSALDPHRPYVDDVTFACPDCGEEARRVPDVIDAWYDSGSMPFAQWGAPHRQTTTLRGVLPGAVHLRGASTRPAAGSTR